MKAIFARTTTDKIKSKILSPSLSELVLEVYITPMEFASLIEKYDSEAFDIVIIDKKGDNEKV